MTQESDYQRMYSAHYRMVLAYCVRRVGRDDGEDLANEVFTVAWASWRRYPSD